MAKISANYEVVFIIDPAQGEEGVAALTEKFKTLVEQNSSAMEVEERGTGKQHDRRFVPRLCYYRLL